MSILFKKNCHQNEHGIISPTCAPPSHRAGRGLPVVNIIRSIYEDTKAIYKLGELETGWVKNVRGVKQGCTVYTVSHPV